MVTRFFFNLLTSLLKNAIYKEFSGSSHMTSKIIDQQNELSSNIRFAIPKTDAEVMQAQQSLAPEFTAKSTKWAVKIWKM